MSFKEAAAAGRSKVVSDEVVAVKIEVFVVNAQGERIRVLAWSESRALPEGTWFELVVNDLTAMTMTGQPAGEIRTLQE